jgi:putative ABC transport system ATP-binding protein
MHNRHVAMITMHLNHVHAGSMLTPAEQLGSKPLLRRTMSETAITREGAATGMQKAVPELRAALETDHLSRAVPGRLLVDGVSVQVRAAEVMAVVGPSGAGKSSFLRLLNRLDEPTAGTVRLDGQDYRELEPRNLRRRIGMVMQSANLFPGTVGENVAFGPLQRGEKLPADRMEELLARVGLPGYQARDVSNLSGGEAQRVSLARTMANAPEVLLLDEPTSALDEDSARRIEELVMDIIHERRMTCIIVTHNAAQAHRIADRTMILEHGRLVAIGPTAEVLHDC